MPRKRNEPRAKVPETVSRIQVGKPLPAGYGRLLADIKARVRAAQIKAADLNHAFPEMRGFSPRNLEYMRAFEGAWPDLQFVQQVAAQILWFHNCLLLEAIKGAERRRWCMQKTIEHGWSRAVLDHRIETALHKRQGKAVTNFARTLPPPQSDLAQQILKDPWREPSAESTKAVPARRNQRNANALGNQGRSEL